MITIILLLLLLLRVLKIPRVKKTRYKKQSGAATRIGMSFRFSINAPLKAISLNRNLLLLLLFSFIFYFFSARQHKACRLKILI